MLQQQLLACKDNMECRRKVCEACGLIYKDNYVMDSVQVEELLKAESFVPTKVSLQIALYVVIPDSDNGQNTFSVHLSHLGFNYFAMVVVDLLHEFELGVWKSLFIYLLRILDSCKGHLLKNLDFRCVHH